MGGMAYYISPPHTALDLITDPFHTLFYLVFVLSACTFRSLALFHFVPIPFSDFKKSWTQAPSSLRCGLRFLAPALRMSPATYVTSSWA
jgi:hypothetical protein